MKSLNKDSIAVPQKHLDPGFAKTLGLVKP